MRTITLNDREALLLSTFIGETTNKDFIKAIERAVKKYDWLAELKNNPVSDVEAQALVSYIYSQCS